MVYYSFNIVLDLIHHYFALDFSSIFINEMFLSFSFDQQLNQL